LQKSKKNNNQRLAKKREKKTDSIHFQFHFPGYGGNNWENCVQPDGEGSQNCLCQTISFERMSHFRIKQKNQQIIGVVPWLLSIKAVETTSSYAFLDYHSNDNYFSNSIF